MKPACIVEFIADSALGGGPRHVIDVLEGLGKQAPEFERHLICPRGWLTEQISTDVDVHTLEIVSVYDQSSQQRLRDILNQIQKEHPNRPLIVHAHGTRAGILFSQTYATNNPYLFVYTEHRWTEDFRLRNPLRQWWQLRLLKKMARISTKIIGVSNAVITFFAKHHIGNPTQYRVIYNGIPIPKIIPKPTQRQSYRIGAVGSLIPVKGFETLIEAAPLIRQNFPDIRIEIIGDGPLRAKLARLIVRHKLKGTVYLLGKVEDSQKVMAEWDLLISTSKTESFGLAIAEAMALAKPVIASTYAAADELITPQTGILIPQRNPHLLAKATIDLLRHPKRRTQMGQAARKRAEKHFAQDRMVQKLHALYQDVITAKGAQ